MDGPVRIVRMDPSSNQKLRRILVDKVLSPDPAVGFILNRPVTSYLNKEAALELR